MSDIKEKYKELQDLTLEERIKVQIWYIEDQHLNGNDWSSTRDFVKGLKYAVKLMQENGWEHLAPSWMDGWKKNPNIGIKKGDFHDDDVEYGEDE